MGCEVWGLRFGIRGLGLRVEGLPHKWWLRVLGSGLQGACDFMIGSWSRASCSRCWVSGFRVRGYHAHGGGERGGAHVRPLQLLLVEPCDATRQFKHNHSTEMCSGSEAGSYLRLKYSGITPLKARGPSRS